MEKNRKFFWLNTAGLSMAVFGHGIFGSLTSMALPMFFTDVLYLAPASVSAIFLITRIWDAINDPIMGMVVDRTRTRWGKCRPYLMFASFPLMLFTIAMFSPVSTNSESGKFAFALITYVLFITSLTTLDIPLSGLKPLLFTEPKDRNKAMSLSSIFGAVASLLAVSLFFTFVVIFGGGNDKKGYFITVVVLSIVAFVAIQGGFFTTREAVPTGTNKSSLFKSMQTVLRNKNLLLLIVIQICGTGIGVFNMMLPYFSKWNLANSFSFGRFSVEAVLIPVLSISTGIMYTVAVVATPYLLKFCEKKKMFIIMSLVGFTLNIFSLFLGYENLALFIVIRILAHFPPTVTGTITGYMIMDCLDYAEHKTGDRTEGTTFAVNNLMGKIINAVFSSFVMLILGYVGYNAAVNEPALAIGEHMMHNYPEMLNGIFLLMTGMPALGCVFQLIPMCFYKLSDKRLGVIIAQLKIRRAAADETTSNATLSKEVVNNENN